MAPVRATVPQTIIEGLDLDGASSSVTAEELQAYQGCLEARGSRAGIAFRFNMTSGAARTAASQPPPPAPAATPAPSRRRGLLQRVLQALGAGDSSGSGLASSSSTSDAFNGYTLYGESLPYKEYLLDDAKAVAPLRTVGHSGPTVLAGLFLHQTRLSSQQLLQRYGGCNTQSAADRLVLKLAAPCAPGYSKISSRDIFATNATANASALAPSSSAPRGIGVDPVFNARSQLYRPDLAPNVSDWYDNSSVAGEVNANNVPYGFFPSPVYLPGFDDGQGAGGAGAGGGVGYGYPVLLDTVMTEKRAQQAMLALAEGAYLDAATTAR